MKNYVTEFIGAFFLVLVIGLASGDLAPLAIGGALMIMVYMGGHVSGAHYNPAVSIACLVRGALDGATTGIYIVSQILGALAGACTATFLAGQATTVAPGDGVSATHALLAEFLLTFALASVVLNVATSKDHPDNSFYGLAIGFTIFVVPSREGPSTRLWRWDTTSSPAHWEHLDLPAGTRRRRRRRLARVPNHEPRRVCVAVFDRRTGTVGTPEAGARRLARAGPAATANTSTESGSATTRGARQRYTVTPAESASRAEDEKSRS